MRILVASLIAVVLAGPVQAAGLTGWLVVLGSYSNPDGERFQGASVAGTRAAAARCGVKTFNDFSMKFAGFARGFDVVVIDGGFASRDKAEAARANVARCIPGAYVKRSRHLGE